MVECVGAVVAFVVAKRLHGPAQLPLVVADPRRTRRARPVGIVLPVVQGPIVAPARLCTRTVIPADDPAKTQP